jgi:hypothetical protein
LLIIGIVIGPAILKTRRHRRNRDDVIIIVPEGVVFGNLKTLIVEDSIDYREITSIVPKLIKNQRWMMILTDHYNVERSLILQPYFTPDIASIVQIIVQTHVRFSTLPSGRQTQIFGHQEAQTTEASFLDSALSEERKYVDGKEVLDKVRNHEIPSSWKIIGADRRGILMVGIACLFFGGILLALPIFTQWTPQEDWMIPIYVGGIILFPFLPGFGGIIQYFTVRDLVTVITSSGVIYGHYETSRVKDIIHFTDIEHMTLKMVRRSESSEYISVKVKFKPGVKRRWHIVLHFPYGDSSYLSTLLMASFTRYQQYHQLRNP